MTASPPALHGSISKKLESGKEMNVNFREFFEKNVLLAPFTTMGIGGPCQFFYEPQSRDALKWCVQWAHDRQIPVLILGGGSNLLIPDEGFPGLVLRMALKGRSFVEDGENVILTVMAGENWDDVVSETVARGLAGLECLSGIPGKCGAAPIQNIGAYGQDVSQTIVKVETLHLDTMKLEERSNALCGFRYRHSIFKGSARGRHIITAVSFQLRRNGAPTIRYPDLKARLAHGATLQDVRNVVLEVRRNKSMVFDLEDPNSHGCGSFFTNPILSEEAYAAFAKRAPQSHPRFPAEPGTVKLSAAWLMEHSGFIKGYGHGSVGLSQNHCLAIVNRGGGKARDVLALVKDIQEGVHARFGVDLIPEPVIPHSGLEG